MPFFEFRQRLASDLARLWEHPDITPEFFQSEFTTPPSITMGHLSLPCFRLANLLGVSTESVTERIATGLARPDITVSVAGSYANFRLAPGTLYRMTLPRIFEQRDRFGSDKSGRGRRIVIEYCSPNLSKKLQVQHVRSTVVGNALANIYDFLGYRVERVNFIGDWGIPFSRLLAAVELWGDKTRLSPSDIPGSMAHLSDLYARFQEALDNDPKCAERARHCLESLERGEAHTTELWRLIRDISLQSMTETLKRLHVRFDHVEGESRYVPEIEKTLSEVKARTEAKLSDGAWIVEVPGSPTPAVIQKRDGTTLYLTRDIAAAIDRYSRFSFDKMLYVVSERQRLHFQLLFGVLQLMGYEWARRCEHLSFGTVLFGSDRANVPEAALSVDAILDEGKELAAPNVQREGSQAEGLALVALTFGALASHRARDIELDWKQILPLDGDTGPYVQHALLKCESLLEKAREKGEEPRAVESSDGYEFSVEEETVVLGLAKFSQALHQSLENKEPHHLTHYLIELAKAFNRFYHRFPVLQATDEKSRKLRLCLVKSTGQALSNGLGLLGISPLKVT